MHINRAVEIANSTLKRFRMPYNVLPYTDEELEETIELLESLKTVEVELCHCSRPVVKEHHRDYNVCTNPDNCDKEHFSRGMCKTCDMVRCDAFPGACKSNHITEYQERKRSLII